VTLPVALTLAPVRMNSRPTTVEVGAAGRDRLNHRD
jgi:hypothetical protein